MKARSQQYNRWNLLRILLISYVRHPKSKMRASLNLGTSFISSLLVFLSTHFFLIAYCDQRIQQKSNFIHFRGLQWSCNLPYKPHHWAPDLQQRVIFKYTVYHSPDGHAIKDLDTRNNLHHRKIVLKREFGVRKDNSNLEFGSTWF